MIHKIFIEIKWIYKFLIAKIIQFLLNRKFGYVGLYTKIEKLLYLINPHRIYLGNNVRIFKNSRIELITIYANEIFSPKLKIGDECQIHQNCHITCAESILINKNVIVVSNVTITDIIHPYENPFASINSNKILTLPVEIGEQSYIYNNVVILPGTKIGKHCVIGANSVVKGEIPDYSIAVGNPARVIKQFNFNSQKWERI